MVEGLTLHFAEARKAVEVAESQKYKIIATDEMTAVAVEDSVSPTQLWSALLDLSAIREEEPVIIVVKDLRTPGAYSLWRPDRHKDRIDFRKIGGERVVFKHTSGFMAVVRGESAEEVATFVLEQLDDYDF